MLSENEIKQLNILYSEFQKINQNIKNAILNDDWDSVEYSTNNKEKLIKKIISFERPIIDKIKSNSELNKFRLQLIDDEKYNLDLANKAKNEARLKLNQVTLTKKVFKTYEPASNNYQSTIDIVSED